MLCFLYKVPQKDTRQHMKLGGNTCTNFLASPLILSAHKLNHNIVTTNIKGFTGNFTKKLEEISIQQHQQQ